MKTFFKKRWKKVSGVLAIFSLVWIIPTAYSDVKGMLQPAASQKDVQNASSVNVAAVGALSSDVKNLEAKINNDSVLNCGLIPSWRGINKDIWVENNDIFLADGTMIGSITFPTPIHDAFLLSFRFVPESVGKGGIGLTLSIKDDFDNELSVTLGDGDYDAYQYVYKERGIEKLSEKKSFPKIAKGKDVLLQLETYQHATSLGASAFLVYVADKKNDESVRWDLWKGLDNLPFFSEHTVYLHLGLRRVDRESSPLIQVAKCEIRNKRF